MFLTTQSQAHTTPNTTKYTYPASGSPIQHPSPSWFSAPRAGLSWLGTRAQDCPLRMSRSLAAICGAAAEDLLWQAGLGERGVGTVWRVRAGKPAVGAAPEPSA